MVREISTFVTIDFATTGLPHQENNTTKIIQFHLLAATRKDIEKAKPRTLPPTRSMSSLLNPEKEISKVASYISKITQATVDKAPTFKEVSAKILKFLGGLDKPVCLVAHNGDRFHYGILLAECWNADVSLPSDLQCVDSLEGFSHVLFSDRRNRKRLPLPTLVKKLCRNLEDVDTYNKAELLLYCMIGSKQKKHMFIKWANEYRRPLNQLPSMIPDTCEDSD